MISSQDIIDIYAIELMYDKVTSSDKATLDFRLHEIKNTYLEEFRKLFIAQISKYKTFNRTYGTSEFSKIMGNLENEPFHRFPYLFVLTLRGDTIRSNDRWVTIAESVVRLEQSRGKGIIQALDALNDVVHNSGRSVLERFSNGEELLRNLNLKKDSGIGILVASTSTEIRKILERVL